MKARVKSTGNIVDVEWNGHNSMGAIYVDVTHTTKYYEYELDFDTVYDYWTRLKHQYAGMAMQGLLSNPCIADEIDKEGIVTKPLFIAEMATAFAHALVQKLKEKEERK